MVFKPFAEAFAALRRKPMALLLLFPLHAFTPLLLLLLPLTDGSAANSQQALWIMLVVFLLFAGSFLYMILRSVLLIAPAMELLHDGAAGQETPQGWFRRGLRKHWWKKISLGAVEYTVSNILSFFLQFLFMPLVLIPAILVSFGDQNAPSVMLLVVFVAISALCFLFIMLFFYALESLGAFVLAALADRGVVAAFRAVFSKTGMKKYLKLFLGRLVILLAMGILSAAFFTGLVFLTSDYGSIGTHTPLTGLLPPAFLSVLWWFAVSMLEIYRFSFDFCVFQELKDSETAAGL